MNIPDWYGQALDSTEAAKAISGFAAVYGQASTILAAHASVLDQFTADIIALIRQNFLLGEDKRKPALDADILFGSLTIDIGNGYFEMDKEVRRQLVIMLNVWGGHIKDTEYRSLRVARFIRYYAQSRYWQAESDSLLKNYLNRIYWVALAYENPHEAIYKVLQQTQSTLKAADTEARTKIYFGGLAKLLALPLAAFQGELTYARAVELLHHHYGDEAMGKAVAMLERIQDKNFSFDDIVLPSPKAILETYNKSQKILNRLSSLKKSIITNVASQEFESGEALTVSAFDTDILGGAPLSDQENLDDYVNVDIHFAVIDGDFDRVKQLVSNNRESINVLGKDKKTSLHFAAQWGHFAIAEYLLSLGTDVDITDLWQRTPLHYSALNGHLAMAELLLSCNADPNALDYRLNTALHMSVCYRHNDIVELLLDHPKQESITALNKEDLAPAAFAALSSTLAIFKKLSPETFKQYVNVNDWTLLQLAAYGGNYDVVEYLLECDFDIDVKTKNTPLMIAAEGGYYDVVELLIDVGANAHELCSAHWGSLHLACMNRCYSLATKPTSDHGAVARHLLKNGVNPDAKTLHDMTALHIAIYHNAQDIVEALIQWGADINIVNGDALTPLLYAISINSPLVSLLLETPNININCLDAEGKNALKYTINAKGFNSAKMLLNKTNIDRNYGSPPPLWQAAQEDTSGIFSLLCFDKQTDVDIRVENKTLLHREAEYGKDYFVRLLLDCGAAVDDIDNYSETPLIKALLFNRSSTVEMLVEAGASQDVCAYESRLSPMALAVSHSNQWSLKSLIKAGGDLQQVDFLGNTLLHLAAKSADLKFFKYLLTKGFDVKKYNTEGMAPLHMAIRYGNGDIVKHLVKEDGKNINRQLAKNGWTPLHFAVQKDAVELMQMFLPEGPDLEAVSLEPQLTLLQVAAQSNAIEACRLLISWVSDLNKDTQDAASPLHLAIANGHFDTAKLLLDFGADSDHKNSITGESLKEVFEKRLEKENSLISSANFVKQILLGESTEEGINTVENKPLDKSIKEDQPEPVPWQKAPLNPIAFKPLAHLASHQEPVTLPWYHCDDSKRKLLLDWLDNYINSDAVSKNKNRDHIKFLLCTLPFYNGVVMVRFRNDLWSQQWRARYFLVYKKEFMPLDGNSPVIHTINKLAPVSINKDNVIEYLRFFGFFVHGDEGPFYLLESENDNAINLAVDRSQLKSHLKKAVISGTNTSGDFLIDATIAYSTAIFRAKFCVYLSGMVEMLSDESVFSGAQAIIEIQIE